MKFSIRSLKAYRSLLISLFLLMSIFSWRQISFLTINNYLLGETINHLKRILFYGIYYLSMVVAIITAAILFKSIYKVPMHLWSFLTVIISIPLLFFEAIGTDITLLYSVASGALFGFGFPFCFAFFAESTDIQSRGRMGATIFFLISLIFIMFGTASNNLNLQEFSLFAIIWMCVATIILWKMQISMPSTRKEIKLKSIISDRSFLLYFISWTIYCLIDLLEAPLLQNFLNETFGADFRNSVLLLGTISAAFFILFTGFLIDLYGRKRILLYGFIALGIAYATVSIAPSSQILWYFYSIIDGIATGSFVIILLFTIWGDLSPQGASEKYYAIGGLPYISIVVIKEIIRPYVILIPVTAAFSFASFFLFLAVIPLMYAPETLPEKLIRRRELEKYVEKAKKIREKYEKRREN